jgi:protein SCO1/2
MTAERHVCALRMLLALLVMLISLRDADAQQQFAVRGMIVSVNREARTFTASVDAIPNYMRAMTMAFDVRGAADLDGLTPGAIVEFTLVVGRQSSHAESIHVVRYESVEQDPFIANRLTLLNDLVRGSAVKQVAIGETVGDFTLTDQQRRRITLSDFSGKVLALNFIYTSCPLPNFCLRLANNFNVLQKRFRRDLGRDLVLLTITFDPAHDTPDVLATYASQWRADTAGWHFLTGQPTEIQRVCDMFGVHAYANEGLLDHSLHTVLIDRKRTLVANIEGNQFTAGQLGDLVQNLLRSALR